MLDKIFRRLRLVFFFSVVLAILLLVADVLYIFGNKIPAVENPVLERWAIIVTLFGIFGALKLLHPKLMKSEKTNECEATRKYMLKYYLRLFVLVAIYIFNLACFHFTGVKNFIFLGIITIFAILFCVPNKENMEDETRLHD